MLGKFRNSFAFTYIVCLSDSAIFCICLTAFLLHWTRTIIIERGPYHFHRLKVVNGIPVVKAIDLSTDPWLALCADVLYHFLQERTNTAPEETERRETEKKTAVTAGTSA